MIEDTGASETISKEEMTRVLAKATDSDLEDIEEGAGEFEVAPPWEADIEEKE